MRQCALLHYSCNNARCYTSSATITLAIATREHRQWRAVDPQLDRDGPRQRYHDALLLPGGGMPARNRIKSEQAHICGRCTRCTPIRLEPQGVRVARSSLGTDHCRDNRNGTDRSSKARAVRKDSSFRLRRCTGTNVTGHCDVEEAVDTDYVRCVCDCRSRRRIYMLRLGEEEQLSQTFDLVQQSVNSFYANKMQYGDIYVGVCNSSVVLGNCRLHGNCETNSINKIARTWLRLAQ